MFTPGLNCLEKKHYRQFAYKRHNETRSRNHCSRGNVKILHIPSGYTAHKLHMPHIVI